MTEPPPYYTRDTIPNEHARWKQYQKTSITRMLRMDGPFRVRTREGIVDCEDGFLAIDAHGWPYPIAADEQQLAYEEVWPQ